MSDFQIVSPVDGSIYANCRYAERGEIMKAVEAGKEAFKSWKVTPFDERVDVIRNFVAEVVKRREKLAELVTWQMGRPFWQADEAGRLEVVADVLVENAREVLKPVNEKSDPDVKRVIEPEPLGVCLSICAWNYPVAMTASLILAPLLMGNVVIFKHAPQTALIADVFGEAAKASGMPEGIFQTMHMAHADAEALIGSGELGLVQFIGSARGGHAVYDAGRGTFTQYGLELGGKDPVYLRSDVQIDRIMGDLLEGCYGNAGQSCCSVERIYVHKDLYGRFVDAFTEATAGVTLGHPIEEKTFIGPLVSATAANRVKGLVSEAVGKGAKALLPSGKSPLVGDGTAYMEPQILVDVDHSMAIMKEETFGPVMPVMSVESDEEAVALMNDSQYGLTAAIWSNDIDRAVALGHQVESGTFYVNRCDHADLYLPFGGVKESGIGRSYGLKGLEELVTTRSFHIRTLG
ncbi:aldehyde dehydrogenase family protein [Emcibacter nanhaiensis]|uniref:Aldehyde dehydrogenase family protein n=1 Tax=Emcibacter nanhaiensis TaxID=1505037 RepID=A0A501PK61_9PROT|nr:aldehyde dehydrogenase family protein [Emcibacter nanhaiensis]TPD60655.1 aldehyde dehydrogenase family protein [Emcibacter nanhaiensis]